jgi:hypothetical protein
VPIGWIIQLYKADAMGVRDADVADKVGWRQSHHPDVPILWPNRVPALADHAGLNRAAESAVGPSMYRGGVKE